MIGKGFVTSQRDFFDAVEQMAEYIVQYRFVYSQV